MLGQDCVRVSDGIISLKSDAFLNRYVNTICIWPCAVACFLCCIFFFFFNVDNGKKDAAMGLWGDFVRA